jgi:catechol 2,3-dioxygenase-like lactoylglutathione lyase family enzyme
MIPHAPQSCGARRNEMLRMSVFNLFVTDQDEARRFYADTLGFTVVEDQWLGDFRWLLVRAPDDRECGINLQLATTPEQQALVGRQGAGQPVFGLLTDSCIRDYAELGKRGVRFEGKPQEMPYGVGVMMTDLYGNRIYLNQDLVNDPALTEPSGLSKP